LPQARAQNCDVAARDALRQQQARPLLDGIKKEIEGARGQALQGGSFAPTPVLPLSMLLVMV
jgi:hypothetical protein